MSYAEICAWLTRAKMNEELRALDFAVDVEKADLLRTCKRRTSQASFDATLRACEFYAHDISEALTMTDTERTITPSDVINLRRMPTAKAIAQRMIGAGWKVQS